MADRDVKDDPQQINMQWEVVQRELQRVEQRMENLERAMMELQQAQAAIAAFAEGEGELESLVPLGGGLLSTASVDPAKPIIIPLGAGYATEGDLDKAQTYLKGRIEATSAAFQAANQEGDRLARTAQAMQQRLMQLQQDAATPSS